jgi:UDP-3-O-[3-hydroxymyristoyl] glucosamine N-acyltransferase
LIGCEHSGRKGEIVCVDSVSDAGDTSLCFVKDRKWAKRIIQRPLVLGSAEDLGDLTVDAIYSDQARLDFARLIAAMDKQIGFIWSDEPPEVHQSVRIGSNVVLGQGCKIGADSFIGHNVVIGPEVIIGDRCNIKSGAIIGEEGFGFERDDQGIAVRLPHLGGVVIADDVEIGSLTTVCRGTLGNTVISRGSKIDDHVHIAHNVFIGEHTFVIACSEISGGVNIGKHAWIAPSVAVRNQLSIGDNAFVGIGSIVIKNVEADTTVVGNPARLFNRQG